MSLYTHKIKYYECDGMGVTHHSNYLRIMEEARLDLLSRAGCSYRQLEAEGIVSPVTRLSIRYLKTTAFEDEVEVETTVKCPTNYRIKFEYVMRVRGEVVCTAENTNCLIKDGQPVPVSEFLPALVRRPDDAESEK